MLLTGRKESGPSVLPILFAALQQRSLCSQSPGGPQAYFVHRTKKLAALFGAEKVGLAGVNPFNFFLS